MVGPSVRRLLGEFAITEGGAVDAVGAAGPKTGVCFACRHPYQLRYWNPRFSIAVVNLLVGLRILWLSSFFFELADQWCEG